MKLENWKLGTIALLAVVLVVVSGTFYLWDDGEDTRFGTAEVTITNQNDEEVTVEVEIADTNEERSQGLSGRDSLDENKGMLFVFDSNVSGGFWMKDTYIPLDIAFIAENGTIIDIQQMEPETTDPHRPDGPYRYALEVNQGYFEDHDITVGSQVDIPEDI